MLDPKVIAPVAGEQPPPPPLVAMSLALKTVFNEDSHANEIVAVSATVHNAGAGANKDRGKGVGGDSPLRGTPCSDGTVAAAAATAVAEPR